MTTRGRDGFDPADVRSHAHGRRFLKILVVPWLFRLPWFRRFDGYAAHWTILLRSRAYLADGDLVTHELCHVWQMQHRPLRMPLSYLVTDYDENPYELQARRAAAKTR